MDIFGLLTVVGGLALFLYGMRVMGISLEKMSGGRLERVLEKMTSNPLKGVLLGAGVTAVMQSSSATTVMTVGFVNAGIIRLSQAVGIIMGANIGTTVTSWILTLAGLESNSIFIQLLKPSSFSPILAIIGVFMIMAAKHDSTKNIGTILIGFSILMFGMQTMSDAVKPLADVPEFANVLTMFSNPILGVAVGAIFTAIIQSSSASVGILQALTSTGSITYGAAIPIIMGQNIGTCITALLSCIGAGKNAKRAAMVHLYFNLIGTVLFLVAFYGLNAFLQFSFTETALASKDIAIIHTIFNIASTLVLLPFSKLIEKLTVMTVKGGDEPKKSDIPILDERFLNTPSFAIEQCKNAVAKMAVISKDAFLMSMDVLYSYNEKAAKDIAYKEQTADEYEDILGTYLVKLSSKELSEQDSHEISRILHSISDFERISDHAMNVLEAAQEMFRKGITFSDEAKSEIEVISDAVREILHITTKAYIENDTQLAKSVEPLEQVIDGLKTELKSRHIARLQNGKCTIELGFILNDLLGNYERVSDHYSNIAVCIIQINEAAFDTHEYLNIVKTSGEQRFTHDYDEYLSKYTLPVFNGQK